MWEIVETDVMKQFRYYPNRRLIAFHNKCFNSDVKSLFMSNDILTWSLAFTMENGNRCPKCKEHIPKAIKILRNSMQIK